MKKIFVLLLIFCGFPLFASEDAVKQVRPKRANRLCCKPSRANLFLYLLSAGVAELADAQDLGSCVNSCRFDPCHPHQ